MYWPKIGNRAPLSCRRVSRLHRPIPLTDIRISLRNAIQVFNRTFLSYLLQLASKGDVKIFIRTMHNKKTRLSLSADILFFRGAYQQIDLYAFAIKVGPYKRRLNMSATCNDT